MTKFSTQKRRFYISPSVDLCQNLSAGEALLYVASAGKTENFSDGGEGGWEQTSTSSTSSTPSANSTNSLQRHFTKGLWDDGPTE